MIAGSEQHSHSGQVTAGSLALARCLNCGTLLRGHAQCSLCGRGYAFEQGILDAIGPLTGTNRVAARFYDSKHWSRFRPWEQLFLWFQGPGVRSAREQVLRHLPNQSHLRVLEVGIGDGENVSLLPSSWELHGVDIARTQLEACRNRFPHLRGQLTWAEAEALPFADQSFDAVYTVGGFNYFRDHVRALQEMRRVARPEAPVVVADELPELYRLAPGHVLGIELLDRWGLRLMGLDPEFIEMVFGCRIDLPKLFAEELPRYRHYRIWNRLGYCMVEPGLV